MSDKVYRTGCAVIGAFALFIWGGELGFWGPTHALAQSAPKSYLSTVSTNCTQVFTGKAIIKDLLPINTTATLYYLKIYDTASTPTAGVGTPVLRVPVPFGASSAGGGVALPSDFTFANGVGFCLTAGIADADTTNAAVGIVINMGVSGR